MIVGVMASGDESLAKKHKAAKEVGSTIAELRFHLLTGGGDGLMKAVGEAFLAKKKELAKANRPAGSLISILRAEKLPELDDQRKRNWQPHADNGIGEIVIRTHLPYSGPKGRDPLSRNHINALTSDLIVILPGGSGTFSELRLAWEYEKDIFIFLGGGDLDGKKPAQLKNEFSGITVGDTNVQLKDWLTKTRTKLASPS
jgi:predicted Rossmann-fold nucleotide-binding protein